MSLAQEKAPAVRRERLESETRQSFEYARLPLITHEIKKKMT